MDRLQNGQVLAICHFGAVAGREKGQSSDVRYWSTAGFAEY